MTQEVTVFADGGSRGNPGPAGYGAVVFGPDDAVLVERNEYIGRATNNVAEYRGLIAGLEAAADVGARVVAVRMDSKLVVEQMSGRWKVKHPDMIPLAARAREAAARFDRVEYEWVPRAQNSHADRLANEAMDDAAGISRPAAAQAVAAPSSPAPSSPSASAASVPAPAVSAGTGWTGVTGKPTRLLLARHGQTALSVDRRYSGRGNPALTDLGRDQAQRLATRLGSYPDIDAIVSSPLQRARSTAEAAGAILNLPVRVLDGLIETDFGAWEGMTFPQARDYDPDLHRSWLSDTSVSPPGGESFDAVAERIAGVRELLIEDYPGKTVLVVTHVTPIKTILRFALDTGPALLYRLHLDLASLSIAEFYPDGGAVVRLVNDTAHLTA